MALNSQQAKIDGVRAWSIASTSKIGSRRVTPTTISIAVRNRTSYLDLYLDLDLILDLESYLDPDLLLDTPSDSDTKSATGKDFNISLYNKELDLEVEEILGDIARFREEGLAKPKHTDQTKKLWNTKRGY